MNQILSEASGKSFKEAVLHQEDETPLLKNGTGRQKHLMAGSEKRNGQRRQAVATSHQNEEWLKTQSPLPIQTESHGIN